MSKARASGKVAHSRFHALSQWSSSSDEEGEGANAPSAPAVPVPPSISMRQRKLAMREAQRAEAAAAEAATAAAGAAAAAGGDPAGGASAVAVNPGLPGIALLGRILFICWKVLQTLICVTTFFLGGFLCGGCCVPWRRGGERAARSHRGHHRRRRRRSMSQLHPMTPATPAVTEADYESWTEDDDDEFEYEPEPHAEQACLCRRGRRCWARGLLCRSGVLLAALLIAYTLVFVRVHPGRDGSSDSLEVHFNFNDLVPSIGVPIPEQLQSGLNALMGEPRRPGLRARRDGLRSHFPIVFVPGIVSTGLEVWEGEECAKSHFRQRMWGSALMVRSILLDSRCWLRHLSLDGWTGVDPEGIKLRPAAGLEASDYLIAGYWVWAKMIENFADVGYDGNSMFMAPYDWRLSFRHLQLRDFFFTKLKSMIEVAKLANHNRKVVLICHSMGSNVLLYFLNWVESSVGGGGGSSWVSDHIESWVNIGGPFLGVPKAFSAVFSGEMRDTAELAPLLTQVRRTGVFSQSDILNIMRTFRSLPSIFPKGGDVVWGDENSAPDDPAPGEVDEPTERPVADYPGGNNESFVTSQASAEKRNPERYEDEQRIQEALHPERRSDEEVAAAAAAAAAKEAQTATQAAGAANDSAVPSARGSSVASTRPGARTGAYQGQFLTFTRPVPWPFPNITRVVEALLRENGGNTSAHSAKRLKQAVQDCADTGVEPGTNTTLRHNVTVSGLNLEDASQLLQMVAWPDMDFNAQLYSQGYGAREGMSGVNQRQSRERVEKEGATDGSPASVAQAVAESVHPEDDSASTAPLDLLDLSSPAVKNDERRWANPLESSLPLAPSLKIYCLYGVGKETERGYVYARASEIPDWPSLADLLPSKATEAERISGQKKKRGRFGRGRGRGSHRGRHRSQAEAQTDQGSESEDGASARSDRGSLLEGVDESEHGNDRTRSAPARHIGARSPTIPMFQINNSHHDPVGRIRSGIKLSDGDATVPLVSLGYMCVDGWKQRRWNPAGLPVVTREYRDPSDSPAMLRSATSVDHVDIMGNSALISDLLYIACIRTKPSSNNNKRSGDGGRQEAKSNATANSSVANGSAGDAVADDRPAASAPDAGVADDAGGDADPSTRAATAGTEEKRGQADAADSEELLVQDDDDEDDSTDGPSEAGSQPSSSSSSSSAAPSSSSSSSIARASGSSAGDGELTWTEVGERIYSRIRPISLRVRQRWERRTGHKLVEADKPPPLNKLRQEQSRDAQQDERATTAAATGSGATRRRFEWTDEDEAQLRRLLELRERAQARRTSQDEAATATVTATDAGVGAAELSKRLAQERAERELQAQAEERSAQRQQSLRNSQRDNAADEEGTHEDVDLTLTAAATLQQLT